ncbi:MAG: ABC transporter permease, partial [bacterium]|nr:ABC transporter permease [bacterium]
VYMIRNVQELFPSPQRFGILWVPQDFAESALAMEAACNNIIGTVHDPARLDEILASAEEVLDSYGVFAKTKRENQISNKFLSDEIRGLGISARIIPAVFLGIASMILLILLNRMVRKERTEIGLLKAYGYTNLAVAVHYLKFALLLAVAGCAGAFFVGQWLAGGMIQIYVEVFQFPILRSLVYPDVLVRSMGMAIAAAVLGALMAARHAARIDPAESMRPEAPKSAHRIWLERMTLVWRNLSFTGKMIARNISRNAFRAGLNIFGVMVSSGILIMGFFAIDALHFMLDFQFNEVRREDVKVSFPIERGKDAFHEVSRFDHVHRAEPVLQYPFEMRSGWRKKDTVVIGLPRGARLERLMDTEQREVDIGESGLVMPERLAQDLDVGVGDYVTLKPLMGKITREKRVPVSKIVKQYLGNSAYMNLRALSRVLDESFVMNAALLKVEPGKERALNVSLKDVPGVSSVEIKEQSYQNLMGTLARNLRITNTMLIIFAAVIACSVIYNVTTVALAERQRELASLRVLGFTTGEVGRIVYHENFLLAFLGILLGMPFGMAVCRWLVSLYDNELYRLPFYISPKTFIISSTTTALFVVLANLAVRHKIKTLDMVEVLKARE